MQGGAASNAVIRGGCCVDWSPPEDTTLSNVKPNCLAGVDKYWPLAVQFLCRASRLGGAVAADWSGRLGSDHSIMGGLLQIIVAELHSAGRAWGI